MKALMRAAALRIPPIRRLYDALLAQSRREQEVLRQLAELTAERDALPRRGHDHDLLREVAVAAEKIEALEIQLYILRSDLQRAAVRNRQLSAALHANAAPAERIEPPALQVDTVSA